MLMGRYIIKENVFQEEREMKKILFGITLILFGICCLMIAKISGWVGIDLLGLIFPIAGLLFAAIGLREK